jgi:hypothetical protein
MRRPAGTIRVGIWLDGLGLGLLGVALSLLLVGLVTVPQRRAQRPGGAGVLALHLEADGELRLWNRRLSEGELSALLRQAARRPGPPPRLRLIPAATVPWGAVRERLETLAASYGELPVELQLP